MESIINPWVVYFLNTVDNLIGLCIGGAVLTGVGLLVYYIALGISLDCGDDLEDFHKNWDRKRTVLWVCFSICVMLAVIMPSKKTILQMYVAKQLTYNRFEKIVEGGKNLKDELKNDIIEILDSVTKED